MTIVTYSARFREYREKSEQQREMEKNECLVCARQCGRHLKYLHFISTTTLWDKHDHLQFRDEEIEPQSH